MNNDIASIVTELKQISVEIKNRAIELSKLRKRKQALDEQIIKFLKEKEQPGIKYQGIAVIAEDKTSRKPKKKSQKMEDCISIMKHYNIDNAERVLKDLIETMKGDEVETQSIVLKDAKDFKRKK